MSPNCTTALGCSRSGAVSPGRFPAAAINRGSWKCSKSPTARPARCVSPPRLPRSCCWPDLRRWLRAQRHAKRHGKTAAHPIHARIRTLTSETGTTACNPATSSPLLPHGSQSLLQQRVEPQRDLRARVRGRRYPELPGQSNERKLLALLRGAGAETRLAVAEDALGWDLSAPEKDASRGS